MDLKQTGKRIKAFIKNPGKRLFIFYAALAVVMLVASVAFSFISRIVAIIFYAVAAILLVICVVVSVYPARRILEKNKFTARIVEDYPFRTLFFSSISCIINFIYAAVALGVSGSSLYISVFVDYYILLGAMRAMLIISEVRINGRTAEDKRNSARLHIFIVCGVLLILLSGTMYIAISYLLSNEVSYNYRDATIVLSIIFAGYKFGLAVYNIFKAIKHSDYITRAMRNLTFADTLVSLFVLASGLAHTFGDTLSFINGLNAIFGGAVCILTIGIGVCMIVAGIKGLRKEKKERLAASATALNTVDTGKDTI